MKNYNIKPYGEFDIKATNDKKAISKAIKHIQNNPKEYLSLSLSNLIHIEINAQMLKRIVALQNSVADEIRLCFRDDMIKMKAVDPAHIALITQIIPASSLIKYEMTANNEQIEIGVDFDKLLEKLSGITKDDIVILDTDLENNDLKIKIGNFSHSIKLTDPVGLADPKTPELVLPVSFKMESKTLYRFIKQAEKISDYMSISVSPKELHFNAENDTEKTDLILLCDEIEDFVCDKNYSSKFSLDYMLSTFQPMKMKYKTVEIKMGIDNPILIIGLEGTETSG